MAARVSALATCGTSHENIALNVGMALMTLYKHYREELDIGKAKGIAAVSRSLFECAMDKQPWAVRFYLIVQGGWRETSVVQNQALDKNGNPIDPPKLGISFSDGGPGHGSRVEVSQGVVQGDEPVEDANDRIH